MTISAGEKRSPMWKSPHEKDADAIRPRDLNPAALSGLSRLRAVTDILDSSYLTSELFRDYVNAVNQSESGNSGRTWHVRPQDVIGEKMLMALSLAHGEFDQQFSGDEEENASGKLRLISELVSAQPFLLHRRAVQLSDKFTLPEHIVSPSVMPYPAMFFCFSVEGLISIAGEIGSNTTDMLLFRDPYNRSPDDLGVCMFGKNPRGELAFSISNAPTFGHRFPGDVEDLRPILQILNFMQSKIARVTNERAPRAMRRREKANLAVQQEVGIIDLREYAKGDVRNPDPDHQSPDHQWRWMVRGHYRAQWYPSEKAHRLLWIDPHVKGPQDRPLRQNVYNVMR